MTNFDMVIDILKRFNELPADKRSIATPCVSYGVDIQIDVYSLLPDLGNSNGYGFDEERQCHVLFWSLINPDNYPECKEDLRDKWIKRNETSYKQILEFIENLNNVKADATELITNRDKARKERYFTQKAASDEAKKLIIPAIENAISAVGASELGISDPRYSKLKKVKEKLESNRSFIELED